MLARADALFGAIAAGILKVKIGRTYPLTDAIKAHEDLQARRTTRRQHSCAVTAMAMSTFPQLTWLEAFRNRVNADPEMKLIGRWFTTSISLSFGETRYVLGVEEGRIGDIMTNPRIDARAAFGFAAPVDVWRKFLSRDPPPLYHDFFAMLMRVPEFRLEGDSLVAMQNARALHRMMNIMRETEMPDA